MELNWILRGNDHKGLSQWIALAFDRSLIVAAGPVVGLFDPGQEEYAVVHTESEYDGEDKYWHDHVDRFGGAIKAE